MTSIVVRYVDIYAARKTPRGWQFLLLRRAKGRTRADSWETIHGNIEPGEKPSAAARRELREETGLVPEKLYNLSRVEAFYEDGPDHIVLIPAFVALVKHGASVRLSDEHQDAQWLAPAAAKKTFVWPRSARAVEDAMRLLKTGSAGTVEDVLRIR